MLAALWDQSGQEDDAVADQQLHMDAAAVSDSMESDAASIEATSPLADAAMDRSLLLADRNYSRLAAPATASPAAAAPATVPAARIPARTADRSAAARREREAAKVRDTTDTEMEELLDSKWYGSGRSTTAAGSGAMPSRPVASGADATPKKR